MPCWQSFFPQASGLIEDKLPALCSQFGSHDDTPAYQLNHVLETWKFELIKCEFISYLYDILCDLFFLIMATR